MEMKPISTSETKKSMIRRYVSLFIYSLSIGIILGISFVLISYFNPYKYTLSMANIILCVSTICLSTLFIVKAIKIIKNDKSFWPFEIQKSIWDNILFKSVFIALVMAVIYFTFNITFKAALAIFRPDMPRYENYIYMMDRALRINRNDIDAHIGKGIAIHEKGEHNRVWEHFITAEYINPQDPHLYKFMGIISGRYGLEDDMAEEFERWREIDPDAMLAFTNSPDFTRLIEDPIRGELLDMWIEIKEERSEKARIAEAERGLFFVNKYLLDGINNKHNYLIKAIFYSEMKDWDNALFNITEALKLDTEYPASYLIRCFVYANLGEFETAYSDFLKFYELEPNNEIEFIELEDFIEAILDEDLDDLLYGILGDSYISEYFDFIWDVIELYNKYDFEDL